MTQLTQFDREHQKNRVQHSQRKRKMITSVGALRERADLDIQSTRVAHGFPPVTKHQSFSFLNGAFYFLKWKSVS